MKNRRHTLGSIGEIAAIERVARFLPKRADIVCGVGDDCAVVRLPTDKANDWLLTSDAVIEGAHFEPGTPPRLIGRKAIGRVLSDIAAMGGEPRWALIDLVAPARTPASTLDGIYAGATRLAAKYGLAIVGGDMARGPALELHVFAAGSTARGKAVLRSGAAVGDLLFVTGSLGGSRQGKHLTFEPRVKEGIFLRKWATSMIDVSDGLASDLRHIVEMSGTGASLAEERIPLAAHLRRPRDRVPAIDHALFDGEDFELLFTISHRRRRAFVKAWKKRFAAGCTRIGLITPCKGVIQCSGTKRRITRHGFQHFDR